jgi:hypothetical protein
MHSLLLKLLRFIVRRPPDQIIGGAEDPYLRRWWLIPRNKFGFNIYLHNFCRDDDDRALHDHPWSSISYVLAGGYFEITPEGRWWRYPGCIVRRKATDAHRIVLHPDSDEVWTIFITGKYQRMWGFHCPKGWVYWKDFTSEDGLRIGRGCDQPEENFK